MVEECVCGACGRAVAAAGVVPIDPVVRQCGVAGTNSGRRSVVAARPIAIDIIRNNDCASVLPAAQGIHRASIAVSASRTIPMHLIVADIRVSVTRNIAEKIVPVAITVLTASVIPIEDVARTEERRRPTIFSDGILSACIAARECIGDPRTVCCHRLIRRCDDGRCGQDERADGGEDGAASGSGGCRGIPGRQLRSLLSACETLGGLAPADVRNDLT